MTAFEGSMFVVCGTAVAILGLALLSLSQAAFRYVAAYERVVEAAVSPNEVVSPVGNGETLEAGVYHTTPADIQEYFKGREAMNTQANKRPRSWDYNDDEYEGFEPGVYAERRL